MLAKSHSPATAARATRPGDATLSVTKAARLLGVHPNTIRAWSDAGRLRYYRINPRGDRRYRLSDLQRFLATHVGGDGDLLAAEEIHRPGHRRSAAARTSATAGEPISSARVAHPEPTPEPDGAGEED